MKRVWFLLSVIVFIGLNAFGQEKANNHYVNAREYIKDNNIGKAKLELDSALQINPRFAEAHWLLGKIYRDENSLENALEQLSETIVSNPKLAQAYVDRAQLHFEMDNHQNYIISDMENAIFLEPDNPEFLRLKAFYYANTYSSNEFNPSYEKAISTLNKAIALDQENAQLYYERGQYKFNNKQILSAMADYNRAVELQPENAEYHATRGKIRFIIEDFDASLSDYDQAINLDPKNAAFYISRGKTKNNLGNFNAAYEDYTYAIELLIFSIQNTEGKIEATDPLNQQLTNVLLLRGLALANEDRPYDACVDFDRAYRLGEEKAKSYIRRYCNN